MVLVGKRTRFSYATEDVDYATEATPERWLGIVTQVNDGDNKTDLLQVKTDSSTLNSDAYLKKIKMFGIEIVLLIQHGVPIAWAFGQDSVSGAGPYIHDISEAKLKSITGEVVNDDTNPHVERYLGCKPKSFKIEWNVGNPIVMRIPTVAQKDSHPDSITAYNTTNDAFKKYASKGTGSIAPFMSEQVDVIIGGVSLTSVFNGSIEGDHQMIAEPVCDSANAGYIAEPAETGRDFKVTLKGYVPSDVYYDTVRGWDNGLPISGTSKVEFVRGADDKMVFTLEDPVVESLSKTNDTDAKRVEFTLSLKPTNITPVVTDAIGVNYLTGV